MDKSTRFAIARTVRGVSVDEFAASIYPGFTGRYVQMVLNGERRNKRISEAIDKLIRDAFEELRINQNWHNVA